MGIEIVESRAQARTVTRLGMRCDENEIPFPVESVGEVSHWVGTATLGILSAVESRLLPVPSKHYFPAAVAINDGSLYAICAPQGSAAPAVWLTASLDAVSVEPQGTVGLVRKRPRGVVIQHPDWILGMVPRGRLYVGERASGNRLKGKQKDWFLLALLGGR